MNKILLFLLFITTGFSFAQESEPASAVEVEAIDSLSGEHYRGMNRADSVLLKQPVTENTVYPKKIKENIQSRYKGNEFDYSTSKPRESFFEKLQRKIIKIIESIFGKTSVSSSGKITEVLIRLFAIVLIGFLLYFIIKYLLGKNGNFIFSKKNKKLDIEAKELHENIHEINFPESIARFENNGDYRSAVRYQFLFILKKMSDRKIIVWNPEKTNKDYVAELKEKHLKSEFSNLSYIFDYVWYGEFSIDKEDYSRFKQQYQSFKL
ncbi:DUF4129 domain-containing protein [Chryseobacterium camelliae]|uniref:DUF4129 domain-containing protein n=1 Tax=Chryseobacterium camelliae TaxID=1265445 RepID=A0ABY7QJY5_9FLAO|nr:DUF4129 domain-containing protein [Chryseobacterium camelliae]WBV59679.1 DUF4129 domain-containing protein [Chryseobacterium camelliae]